MKARDGLLGAVVWLLCASIAEGQPAQDARIIGTVVDASGAALVGVALTAESPQLIGGPRQTLTDEEGRYHFLSLPAGSYRVRATLQGFTTVERRHVMLRPGVTLAADFELQISPVENAVIVPGGTSMLDVRSSSSSTLIDRTALDNLPLDRNVINYVNLAPGVTRNVALGGSAFANPITLDGASGDEPGWGTPSAPLTRTWLDEIQIVGPGADIQSGGVTGVLMNGITRSGTNRFDGLVEFWTTKQAWTDDNRGRLPPVLSAQFRPLEVFKRWEGSGQSGGPIRRDRLWFFTGATRYRDETRAAAFTALPRSPDEPPVSVADQREIAKLTWGPRNAIRVDGYVTRNARDNKAFNAGPLVMPESMVNQDRRDLMWNGRMVWTVGSKTVVEAQHGGNDRDDYSGPPPERLAAPSPRLDQFTGQISVNATFFQKWRSRIQTSSAALTHLLARGRHVHEIKAGIQYERARLSDGRGVPSGRLYLDFEGRPDLVQLSEGRTYRGRHSQTSLFVQDTWTLASPITLNAGVRLGVYRSAPPYPAEYATEGIAPRVGLAWDVGAAHTTVLRLSVGRSYDPMVTSYYDFLDPLTQNPDILAREVAPGVFQEVSRVLAVSGYSIDPDVRQSFVQEWLTSVERALGPRMTVRGDFIYRSFGDTVSFIDTTTIWRPIQLLDPGPDGRVGTADDPGLITVYENSNVGSATRLMTNPPQAYKNHRAAQVVLSRRDAERWNAQASYTWSRTRANYQNAFTSNAANNDNSGNSVFVNPNRAINNDGETSFSFTHSLKGFGSIGLPWFGGWRVSAVYRLESGPLWGRQIIFSGLPQGFEFVRAEPPTRKSDMIHTADVRIEKSFAMPGRGRAELGLFGDVFNVTNAGAARGFVAQSGPRFGLPQVWIEPRVLRLGGRVTF